jgi:predicted membrane-bound spermidine synthase
MLNESAVVVCVIVGILLALFTLTQPLVPMAGALLLALVSLVLLLVHSSRVSNGKRREKYLKEIIEPLKEQRRKDLIAQFREKYGEKPEL